MRNRGKEFLIKKVLEQASLSQDISQEWEGQRDKESEGASQRLMEFQIPAFVTSRILQERLSVPGYKSRHILHIFI